MGSPFSQLRSYQRNLRYQGYQSVPVERFGGLRLDVDPSELGWSGAIDLLDVDLNHQGILRDRDRYNTFVTNTTLTSPSVFSWPLQGYLASTAASLKLFSIAGALVGTAVAPNQYFPSGVAAFGTPTTSYLYLADHANANAIRRLTTAGVISAPAGMPTAKYLTRSPTDNRLVAACVSGHTSRVQFSDAGDAETWGVNNFVDLDPGDGEDIQGVCTWRDLTFVFKLTKFFVFYGTSQDSSGNPVFNYRAVRTGIGGFDGGTGAAVGVAPDGVYFVAIADAGIGVFKTTGDTPVRVSRAVDPALGGYAPSTFTPGNLTQGAFSAAYANGRFSFSALDSTGSSARYLFHYDPALDIWLIDDTGATFAYVAPSPYGNLLLLTVDGANAPIHVRSPGYAGTDSLRTSTPRYRSGFYNVPGRSRADGRQVIRQWKLKGTGTVTFGVSADDASAIPTTGGGAQASVALAGPHPNYRTAQLGYDFSWQVSSTTAFTLGSVEADIA